MRIDIMTLFPEMCGRVLDESIIGRSRESGLVEINCVNIRDFSTDKHRRVDDTTYGGGTTIKVIAAGPDEEQAVDELVKLVNSGFAV